MEETVIMRKSKIAFIMLLFSVAIAFFFTYKVVVSGSLAFDRSTTAMFFSVFPEQTRSFFKLMTIFGSKIGIGVVSISLILWLWFKKRDFVGIVVVVVGVGLGNELNQLIKNIIDRPRPSLEHLVKVNSYSYPSGHAMVGIILYMVVAYFIMKEINTSSFKWTIGILLTILIFLVGASRVVLQVHYPSDVFGGFAWGYIWVYIIFYIYEGYIDRKKH
ncbi:MAG: PA-phosphatase-like phosphoesterase [Bacillus sp. (in: firmicutes)]|jgi:undecaprenyl-diphosphatase|nr:PA-phosphatase-like phosphoesterase [Bacillus sp. (in: firmicutes)]